MAEVPRLIEDLSRHVVDAAHRQIVHPLLTSGEATQDREKAHERFLDLAEKIQSSDRITSAIRRVLVYQDPILETEFAGVRAPNPLGIAAGFDKNARLPKLLGESLGFGIVTVGSITKIPYKGNERPRIFDLPLNNGLINRMGFPGDGEDEAIKRLGLVRPDRNYVLVVSTAASNPSFKNGTQIQDYIKVYINLGPYGDADEVNVSSPNTLGLRGIQEPEPFLDLASGIENARFSILDAHPRKPLSFKLSSDLLRSKREKDLQIAIDHRANGVTFSNTTTDQGVRARLLPDTHRQEIGGISGAPLRQRALEVAHEVYAYSGESLAIKFAGGIASARDAWNALTYGGATTIDVYSAFVRPNTSTPNFAYYLLRDLAAAMRREGMSGMGDFRELRGRRVPYPGAK